MRIAFFDDATALGGGELWVLRAGRHLAAAGHQVTVVCPWRSALFHRALAAGLDTFSYLRMNGIPVYEPIFEALRRRGIDVLHCTVIGTFPEARALSTLVDRLNRGRRRSPAALVLKTGLPPMRDMAPEQYGVGGGVSVARLHVVSEHTRQAFLHWSSQFTPSFVEVAREGIEVQRFADRQARRAPARARWGLADHETVVCTIARLGAMKGLDNLLLAARRLVDARHHLRFLVAGEGDQRQRLVDLRDHLGLGDRVRFLGQVDEVPDLLAASDLLCHPALVEGLPNAIVEAMASGVPVVATDVGGIPELVRHEDTGLLVPPHDVKALAGAVVRLLDDAPLAARLSARARESVRTDFDLHANLDTLLTRLGEARRTVAEAYARQRPAPARLPRLPVDVLFVMNALRIGGEETELLTLARHLNRERFRLHVASLMPLDEPSIVARLRALGIPVDTRAQTLGPDDAVAHLRAVIRSRRIRVVVACQDARLAARAVDGLGPRECALIEHGGVVAEVFATNKRRTARYVGVSRAIRDAAATVMPSGAEAVLLPSMVDTDAYAALDREALRRGFGFAPESVVVTFVGRLDPKKRVEDLLEAVGTLLPRHPTMQVLVVGGVDALQPQYASDLVQRFGSAFGTRVVFAGARGDVPEILTASDVLVLPATGEGMSHVINEAGAAGLAVVAVDDGAAREQLANGGAGCLVPAARPDLLARALDRLAVDPDLRRTLGERLRERVTHRYGARRLVPRWERLLASVAPPPLDAHGQLVASLDRPLDFPSEIQVQTVTTCNAACVMCPYPTVSKELPHERMDEALFDSILDECAQEPGLRRIEPFLMNEAFTDNRIVDWIARAKQRVPHARVTVTTNGAPLVPKVTDRLVRSGLDAIWFSFNGATPETYERIMGIPFDRVKANIDYLLQVRPPTLQVFVNMIETTLMAPEIAENIRYWESRGVRAGTSMLVNRAGNVANYDDLRYTPQAAQPVRTCELVFYKMYIRASGDVVLCCMDWRRQSVLGNVRRQRLRDIWNGETYRHIRQLHVQGRDREIALCRGCSYTLS